MSGFEDVADNRYGGISDGSSQTTINQTTESPTPDAQGASSSSEAFQPDALSPLEQPFHQEEQLNGEQDKQHQSQRDTPYRQKDPIIKHDAENKVPPSYDDLRETAQVDSPAADGSLPVGDSQTADSHPNRGRKKRPAKEPGGYVLTMYSAPHRVQSRSSTVQSINGSLRMLLMLRLEIPTQIV